MTSKWDSIPPDQVLALARVGCTTQEIARIFGVSASTIKRHFQKELSQGRVGLNTRLRRAQIKAAEAGSVPMLIWLGKQLLRQSDKKAAKASHKYSKLSDAELAEAAARRGLHSPNWGAQLQPEEAAPAEE